MPNRVTPYEKTTWINRPSTNSPINDTNLNHLEQGVKNVTDALNNLVIDIPPATNIQLGGIIVGDRLSIDQNGRLSADQQIQDLPIASSIQLGGIKVGNRLTIDQNGILSADDQSYSLPTASQNVLGGIKVGDRLSISNGVLSATDQSYTLPTASQNVLGGVKVGSNLSIDQDGTLSADVLLPIASVSQLGGIKVGTNLTIDQNGVLSAVSGSYTPTPATDTNLGCIKVGSGLSITQDGTLSATGGGSITVDDELSTTSTNPVQNKVITVELNKTFKTTDSEISNVSSDNDTFPLYSAAFGSAQKVKWSRIKSQLKTYFDTYYNKYTLPTASSSTLGGVKVGSNLSIDSNGVLSADAQQYILPTASTSTLGGVKIDGSTITIDQNGVISSSGGGGTIEYATSEQIIALFNDGTDVYLNGDSTSVTF